MALFQVNSPFKCAISGAPVSDWLFYGIFHCLISFYRSNKSISVFMKLDSAYSERYLGSYAQNRQAYEVAVIYKFKIK